MRKFEAWETRTKTFEFRVGTLESAGNCKEFGDQLWVDIARIVSIPIEQNAGVPDGIGGYNYEFQNDDVIATMFVDDGEPGWPLEKVPAMLTAWSTSGTDETKELAEKLFDQLVELGNYLVLVFSSDGMPIAANFDIGDDW
ncbi:hypothetical protein ACF1FC_20400 [Streptomyces sp. NPDC014344]|uniref:hypothetical protein n=1 Tax=Streptomyces sp. NPDC014344 TaxID=3364871 RepID=UPI0036F6DEA8